MPTYAYACKSCGHTFEVRQSFSDDALTVCPECDGQLRKLFNAVGVVFKGSGFYRTDSRGSGSSMIGSDSSSSSSTSSETSSSSSPAAASNSGSTPSGSSSASASSGSTTSAA